MRKKDGKVMSGFFALLGPMRIKAAHKMLVKLTPGKEPSKVIKLQYSDCDCNELSYF